jgi:hypothetical protein
MLRVSVVSTAALLALVASAAGCGSTAPALVEAPAAEPVTSAPPIALTVDQAFFIPGEQMTWALSLRGIFGGEAVMAMGEPGYVDGRHVLVVRSRTATAGAVKMIKEVRDDITTWIDIDSSLPIRISGELKFGARETRVATEFTKTGYTTEYQRLNRDKKPRKHKQVVPTELTHDTHSLIGVMRAWNPEAGTRAYFYTVAGRRLWHNSIRFTGRETKRTRMGLFPTMRFDGVATRVNRRLLPDQRKKPRSYTVWFSDDAKRMPLLLIARTEYGDVAVELIDYQRPETLVSSR